MISRSLPLLILAAIALAPACSRPDSASDAEGDDAGTATEASLDTSNTAGSESSNDDASDSSEDEEREAQLVRVAPLLVGPVEKLLEATANVESLDVVDVMPERAEPVIEVLVEEGDRLWMLENVQRVVKEKFKMNFSRLERYDQELRLNQRVVRYGR